MIKRVWRGWTTPELADDYQKLLTGGIVPAIRERRIDGHVSTEVLRRSENPDSEVEFMTIMSFTDWDAVSEFTGGDPTVSVVPPEARRLLARFENHSEHFETIAIE